MCNNSNKSIKDGDEDSNLSSKCWFYEYWHNKAESQIIKDSEEKVSEILLFIFVSPKLGKLCQKQNIWDNQKLSSATIEWLIVSFLPASGGEEPTDLYLCKNTKQVAKINGNQQVKLKKLRVVGDKDSLPLKLQQDKPVFWVPGRCWSCHYTSLG